MNLVMALQHKVVVIVWVVYFEIVLGPVLIFLFCFHYEERLPQQDLMP